MATPRAPKGSVALKILGNLREYAVPPGQFQHHGHEQTLAYSARCFYICSNKTCRE